MDLLFQEWVALKSLMGEHPLFTVGILLLAGYLIGRLAVRIHLPEITGYIFAGLLLGEGGLHIIPFEMHSSLKLITDLAFGLIALAMGGEFFSAKLKRMGRDIFVITLVQMAFTFAGVTAVMVLVGIPLPFALLLGVIATATDPASTGAKVQTLRARGRFIDYLYGVIALDDAFCVAFFGFMFAGVVATLNPAATGAVMLAVDALRDILFSVLTGLLVGYVIHMMTRNKQGTNEILIITLGVLFVETALAIVLNLSPLLANMVAGAFLVNASPKNHRLFRILEPLTPPVYALFFVIAGTELNPSILLRGEVLLAGFAFVLMRGVMKYAGVRCGATVCNAGDSIRKYLGLCMFPQAGVSIGLVLLIQASPIMTDIVGLHIGSIQKVVNIVLLSVFVNELIGPSISKYAILKALKED